MGKLKKLFITGLICMGALGVTGCTNTDLMTSAKNSLSTSISDRGTVNKEYADQLYEEGILTKSDRDAIKKSINTVVKTYTKGIEKLDEKDASEKDAMSVLNTVAKAVSDYTLAGNGKPSYIVQSNDNGSSTRLDWHSNDKEEGGGHYCPKNENDEFTCSPKVHLIMVNNYKKELKANYTDSYVMSDYIEASFWGGRWKGNPKLSKPKIKDDGTLKYGKDKDNYVDPIKFLSTSQVKQLNTISKVQLCVLKSSITEGTLNNDDKSVPSIDGVSEIIKKTIDSYKDNSIDSTKAASILKNYFTDVKVDGKPVYLINNEEKGMKKYRLVDISKNNDGSHTGVGYDQIVPDKELTDALHICYLEFNGDFLENMKSLGLETTRMFLLKDGSAWKAYLMEYPLYTIDEISDTGKNNKVKATFKKSGLGVNLYTQKWIKYPIKNGSYDYESGTETNVKTGYLTLAGASNNNATGQASVLLKGSGTNYIVDGAGIKRSFLTGRLILQDYLEATYAPGYTDDENLVCFGRKMRVKMTNSNFFKDKNAPKTSIKDDKTGVTSEKTTVNYKFIKDESCITFVDQKGKQIENSPSLGITDLCDASALDNSDYTKATVISIVPNGMKPEHVNASFQQDSLPNENELESYKIDDKGAKIGSKSITSIKPAIMFPGSSIDNGDYTSDSPKIQRFYCLTTTKGLFDSGLFSDWINSSASTCSLDWWNKFLSKNGYTYKLDHNDINDYVSGNYSYEISENGIVVLDLDVVAAIQKQYNKEADANRVRAIRTAFKVIGYILIIFSMFLMLLWIVDTNIDVGVGFLNKVSFGHWQAVKYPEDIPEGSLGDVEYMTAGKLFMRCLVIISLGILLILVNVFDIVEVLLRLFGPIALALEDLISGMRE